MTSAYKTALKYFYQKQYNNAYDKFLSLGMFYECGYCKFIQGDLDRAQKYWSSANFSSPALEWGLRLICLIKQTIPDDISFFQIRNFLERDMQLLIENNQLKIVEKILSASDILAEFNPEVYKFIGRVLFNNAYFDLAGEFLEKAKDIYYGDCEIHYLLAQYYLVRNEAHSAIKILKKSLSINPEYFPARNLLKKLI